MLLDVKQIPTPPPSEVVVAGRNDRRWVEHKSYTSANTYGFGSPDDSNQGTNSKTTGTNKVPSAMDQVGQLARLLNEAGSHEFHTLPFQGYRNEDSNSRFAFYFGYPPDASDQEPLTLRQQISMQGKDAIHLPQRFHIALTISRALGAFHADGWVHKSIRSHSILFFHGRNSRIMHNKPYLVDFEFSRPEAGETLLMFEDDLEKNLYQHPERLSPPIVEFNRVHDVYALGVVLLELGLWKSAESIYEEVGENAIRSARRMQEVYLACARESLGHIMGPAYSEAVVTCLSGELGEFLATENFAFIFHKRVVEKVKVKQLQDLSL